MTATIKEIPSFSVESIRTIGKEYLEAHPTTSPWHSNQPLAKFLKTYDPTGKSDIEKWLDLFNVFGMLKAGGSLYTSVAALTKKAFGVEPDTIRQQSIFEAGVSSFKISSIGKNYIALVKKREQSFFDIHNKEIRAENLRVAKCLMDKSSHYKGHKRWLFLYLTFKGLENKKGTLGLAINSLFEESFGASLETVAKALDLDNKKYSQKYLESKKVRRAAFSISAKQFLAMTKSKVHLNTQVATKNGIEIVTNVSVFWNNLPPVVRGSVAGFVIITTPILAFAFLPVGLPAALLIGTLTAAPFVYVEAKGRGIKAGNNINAIHKQLNDEYGALNEVHEENNTKYSELNEQNQALTRTNEALAETNAKSARKLETTSAMMKGMFGNLTSLVDATKEQQEKFISAMEDIVKGQGDAAKEALYFLTGFKEEIERLKLTVDELRAFAKGFKDYGQYLLDEIKQLVKANKSATNEQMLLAIYEYIQNAESHTPSQSFESSKLPNLVCV